MNADELILLGLTEGSEPVLDSVEAIQRFEEEQIMALADGISVWKAIYRDTLLEADRHYL